MPLILASQEKTNNTKRRFQRTKKRDLLDAECMQIDSGDQLKSGDIDGGRGGRGGMKSLEESDIKVNKAKTANNLVSPK